MPVSTLHQLPLKSLAWFFILIGCLVPCLLAWPPSYESWIPHLYVRPPTSLNTHSTLFFLILSGPTWASWGVLLWTQVHHYFQIPSHRSWGALLCAILLVFPLHAFLCRSQGLYILQAIDHWFTLISLGFLILAHPSTLTKNQG